MDIKRKEAIVWRWAEVSGIIIWISTLIIGFILNLLYRDSPYLDTLTVILLSALCRIVRLANCWHNYWFNNIFNFIDLLEISLNIQFGGTLLFLSFFTKKSVETDFNYYVF